MAKTLEAICPTKCQNGYASKQRLIYTAERRDLSKKIETQASLLHGTLHVCEACKCIYITHWRGVVPVGYLKIVAFGVFLNRFEIPRFIMNPF
jgi:hypothetical protein